VAYKSLSGTEKQSIGEACVELSKKITNLKKQGPVQGKAAAPRPAEEIKQLLPKAEEYVKEGKKDLAMQTYQRIMRDYKELPEDQKPAIYQRCNDLYAKLTAIA
jgi:microcompartment protein CcmL/EutN